MSRSGKAPIALALALAPILLALGARAATGRADDSASRRVAALKAAEAYLVLVDKGKYSESWAASSEWFRKGMTRPKWIDGLAATRKPLGRLRSRKLDKVELRGEAPERPVEAWIYSDLRFASGQRAAELIVVVFEGGKEWRTSGYYVATDGMLPQPPPRK